MEAESSKTQFIKSYVNLFIINKFVSTCKLLENYSVEHLTVITTVAVINFTM